MDIDWQRLRSELSAHFDPSIVRWRVQGQYKPGTRVKLLAYLDVSQVTLRLDMVCPGWGFDWEPIGVNAKGEVLSAKGTLTIFGSSRSEIGTATIEESGKGAVMDALKRCASLFGVGTYLSALPEVYVTLDAEGRVPPLILSKLAEHLAAMSHSPDAAHGQVNMSSPLDISEVSTSLLPPHDEHKSA